MEYCRLGQTELEVSRLSFGCWAIGGHGYGKTDDAESIAAINCAIDEGINLFDTADIYGFGHSEEVLGRAILGKRDSVMVATKFGVCWDSKGVTFRDCSPGRARKAAEESLRRMRIDVIDLYQLHWYDGTTPIDDILHELEKLRQEGKIRHYGCSNFTLDLIQRRNQVSPWFESLQTPFSLLEKKGRETIVHCGSILGMGVLVYGVLKRGLLSGKYQPGAVFGESDTRARDRHFSDEALERILPLIHALKEIGARYGKTAAEVAIRWALDESRVTSAIVGIKTPEQLRMNIGALNWELASEDWRALSSSPDWLK
jgi:aryl-alcohol dehydrogenase-like predicted oxidoreductase